LGKAPSPQTLSSLSLSLAKLGGDLVSLSLLVGGVSYSQFAIKGLGS